uniref:Dolichyldiphosphatase 1 n=2 Tax=Schistocephalus solidus TaxID=70667 RepID=A0A0X3NXM7_SCHSO
MDHFEVWKPLSTFFVLYQRGDKIGHVLAWSSEAPLIIASGVLAVAFFRRDLHSIFYVIGMLFNEFLNYVLKHLIKAPRPLVHPSLLVTGYAMPSNHSQFMFFMACYLFLFCTCRLLRQHYSAVYLNSACIFALLLSCITAYSRLYLGFHTFQQICIGSLIGIIAGFCWFLLVHFILIPRFSYITDSRLGRFLMLQNLTFIPNVLQFDYLNARRASSRIPKKHGS